MAERQELSLGFPLPPRALRTAWEGRGTRGPHWQAVVERKERQSGRTSLPGTWCAPLPQDYLISVLSFSQETSRGPPPLKANVLWEKGFDHSQLVLYRMRDHHSARPQVMVSGRCTTLKQHLTGFYAGDEDRTCAWGQAAGRTSWCFRRGEWGLMGTSAEDTERGAGRAGGPASPFTGVWIGS